MRTTAPTKGKIRRCTQGGFAILTIVLSCLFQFVNRPFWDKRVNWLDCFCCVSIMLHCIGLLYWNNIEFAVDQDGDTGPLSAKWAFAKGAIPLDGILVAICILNFAAILALFACNLVEMKFRRHIIDALSRTVARAVIKLQVALRVPHSTPCGHPTAPM